MQPASAPTVDASGRYPRKFVALLVFVLGVLAATGPLATDLYLPALPEIAADLGTTEARIQLTLTSMMVGLALGQLVIGPMSDTWGRRTPLVIGIIGFAVTSFAVVFAPSVDAFIVLRFLQGVAGAAGAVISRAVVRDLFEGEEVARFMSRLMLIVGLAPMIGPVLGGQILLFGSWRLMFTVLGVAAVISLVLVYFWLPESLPAEKRAPQRPAVLARTFLGLLTDRRFIVPTLAIGFIFGTMFTYISSFSFVAQSEFNASPQTYSLIFGFNTLGMIAGTQINAALIGRVSMGIRLMVGLFIMVVSVLGMGLLAATGTATLTALTVLLLLTLFGAGFSIPNAMTIAVASQPVQVAGTASALIGSIQFAFGGAIGALGGVVSGGGDATLGSMTAVMGVSALVALGLGFLRPNETQLRFAKP
ncbi:multidrug effflux MFS transporter [Spiractinospora alimapuensis]|uniref:multidrug effflux MFS transporter n=1 Tax=Spiractinospora alimapuensis TaxID=2820884 RepID=UPI001F3E9290|nr:multidrug effflux MFS transporter [Spiractinospora alimapuensis]